MYSLRKKGSNNQQVARRHVGLCTFAGAAPLAEAAPAIPGKPQPGKSECMPLVCNDPEYLFVDMGMICLDPPAVGGHEDGRGMLRGLQVQQLLPGSLVHRYRHFPPPNQNQLVSLNAKSEGSRSRLVEQDTLDISSCMAAQGASTAGALSISRPALQALSSTHSALVSHCKETRERSYNPSYATRFSVLCHQKPTVQSCMGSRQNASGGPSFSTHSPSLGFHGFHIFLPSFLCW